MLNRVIVIAYIMYGLVGCTYEVQEDDMVAAQLQQRSKTGDIIPGNGSSGINFSLPFLLGSDGKLDPGEHTVQFTVRDPNTALALGSQVKIRAEIFWITSGNYTRRVVDVGNGVSISGQCDGIAINVFDESTILGVARAVTVSLAVAKGSRPSVQKPPIYTLGEVSVGPGADGETVVIPDNIGATAINFAVRPNTIGTAIGAYDVIVFQMSRADGTGVLAAMDPRQDQWIPLVAGCRSISIQTSAAAPLVDITPIIGIDG